MVSRKDKGKKNVIDDGGKGEWKLSGGGDKTGRKRRNRGTIQFFVEEEDEDSSRGQFDFDFVKIEDRVDYEKPKNENGSSKRVKKKKSQSSMPKGNENSNNQIVHKAGTSAPILESEDEEGFPVHAHNKKSGVSKSESNLDETKQENIGQKSQNKSEKPDAASRRNLKRKRGAVNQDEQPARETEPHYSGPTSHHRKRSESKEKHEEKVVQKLDSSLEYGKPESDGTEKSPVAEAGNDMKPSSEKKKTKESGKKEKDLIFSNGVRREILAWGKPGGMVALKGRKISVRYSGKLMENDEIFDSTENFATYKFVLGSTLVIPGWNVGVDGMRVGARLRLTIPPLMGYEAKGSPPDIPPNALLIYEMTLVNVTK